MKILVICQYYFPEPFRVNDICEELVRRGHEVTVITGEPNYPEGRIYSGYENHAHADEVINGVTVHRCPIIPRKTGSIYRLLNYFSYPRKAKKYVNNLMASNGKPFDVVFVNQLSPVMMGEPGLLYKKRFGVPVILYCLDLWPESLVAGGIKRDSIIYKMFHRLSKRIYKNVDRILITSRMFRDYLKDHFNIENERIEYLPQYAEGIFEQLPFKKTGQTIDFVFAGNLGKIQSVETVIRAAEKLQNEPVHFHIVGGGTDLDRLQDMANNLENVTFYDRRPLEEMPEFYAKADAMLVTLKSDPVLSMTLPGKVQSYMAVGKPIIGAIDGETSEVINAAECGYCGPAEDVDELVKNVLQFSKAINKERMGHNARAYYELHFDRKKFMDKLEKELQ
jgi:glycosyltransferase involved in cell wall biosynthesis